MIADLLLKIEKLHEFIDECAVSDSLSLIDKDIILQNLRDIYVDASRMSIGDYDADFDDDFENENIILFDTKEPLKQIENQPNEDFENKQDEIDSVETEESNDTSVVLEDISLVVDESDELSIEEDEKVVYMESDDNDLEVDISDHERELIIRELCSMDENKYRELIDKLNSFTDLDDVLIYISEEFPSNQNSQSAVLLADKMSERLA